VSSLLSRRALALVSTASILAATSGAFLLAGCGGGDEDAGAGMTDTGAGDTEGGGESGGDTNGGDANGGGNPSGGGDTNVGGETNDGPATAPLSFELDLEGPVAFADRYSVELTIDGTDYDHGFCGFGDESTRCSADLLYDWELPSVRVGATLSWRYTLAGTSTFQFAGGQEVTFGQGMSVAATCTYQSSNDPPSCHRTS
jgi:hypothetical protein